MLADIKLEIGDKALFESKEKIGQKTDSSQVSFLLRAEALEGVIGILILLGINYYWFRDNPGFLEIHPHPYWFILLPIAVRYGLIAGSVAGITAFIVQLFILLFFYTNISFFEALYNHALIFLLVSLFIGLVGEIRRTEHVKQKHDFSKLEKEFSRLLTEYNALVKYKEKKNSEIISQEDTFSSLYKAQEKVNTLDESKIYPALIQLLERYLSVTEAAIYILSDDKSQLKQVINLEGENNESQPETMDIYNSEIHEILYKGHILTLNDLISRPELHTFFENKIMCAPIRGVRNRPLGIIIINAIPFDHLTLQSFQMLKSISDRCGASIEKARVYQLTRQKMVLDEVTGVLTFSYLKERFDEEFSRARRYGYTMSILIFEIQSFYGCEIALQQTVLMRFKKIIEKKLRNIDLLFHGEDRSQFILVLPNTPIWGSRVVRNKLIEEMSGVVFKNEQDQDISFSVIGGAAGMSLTMTFYNNLLEAAFLDLNFQKKLNDSFQFACSSDDQMVLLLLEIMDFDKFSKQIQQDISSIIDPLLNHYTNESTCMYKLENAAMYALFWANKDHHSVNEMGQQIIHEIKAFKVKPYEDKEKDLLVLTGALRAKSSMKTPEKWKQAVLDKMYNSEIMLVFRYKFDNAKESNDPLTVMVVEIADYKIFSDDNKKDITSSLSLIFQNMLGDMDIMFYDSAPARHVLFLFHIDIQDAQKMRERILSEIRSFEFKPYTYENRNLQIEAGIAQLYDNITMPEKLIENADEDLRFTKNVWYACLDARNRNVPFCIISFKILHFDRISQSLKKDIFRFVTEIFFHYQENEQFIIKYHTDAAYLILLPDTTFNAATVINMSITDEITDFHMRPYRGDKEELNFKTTVFPYNPDLTHYQQIQKAMQL
jgi:PleD family two-component response regulator